MRTRVHTIIPRVSLSLARSAGRTAPPARGFKLLNTDPRSFESQWIASKAPDDLSADNTKREHEFLGENSHAQLAPRLNDVEFWFSKVERGPIRGDVFTSVEDLARTITRYIRRRYRDPRPIKWTYDEFERIIPAESSSVTVL